MLEYLPAWLLLTIGGLIVFHAPITVWVGVHVPSLALGVKAWKEILMLVAAGFLVVALMQVGQLKEFIKKPVIALALLYIAIHIISLGFYPQAAQPAVAGLMIDLRYIVYFVLVYAFLTLYPSYKKSFILVGVTGALIVVGFAVMQLFLPKTSLEALGYGDSTIKPYMTVDQNPDYIRHNSTLRGPNPLGAYASIVLAGVVAYGVRKGRGVAAGGVKLAHVFLAVGGAVALWISYSRSAVLGTLVAIIAILVAAYGWRLSRRSVVVLASIAIVAGGLLFAFRDTNFIKNVVLHNSPTTGAAVDSNAGHLQSLQDSLGRLAVQPFGAGIGSTGSASILNGDGLIIENQYLMIAHEVGWAGLGLFIALFITIMIGLWSRRQDWLALTMFGSGLGLAVVGLMLPVWADDTVSIIWWGLAAVMVSDRSDSNKM